MHKWCHALLKSYFNSKYAQCNLPPFSVRRKFNQMDDRQKSGDLSAGIEWKTIEGWTGTWQTAHIQSLSFSSALRISWILSNIFRNVIIWHEVVSNKNDIKLAVGTDARATQWKQINFCLLHDEIYFFARISWFLVFSVWWSMFQVPCTVYHLPCVVCHVP